ncbi:MAG: hypothetical protein A2V66_10440 [Ignavibacteria bacterium RBG_13_36_8]|nr:MAG: hypothetical protein A2V66_10440 [Ignavibacteria bacterium RBG_13_36_8]
MVEWDDYWADYSISKGERWMVEQRHKILLRYFDKIQNVPKQVIEIGCGFGSNIKLLQSTCANIECHALDKSGISIEKVQSKIPHIYIADARDTGLSDASFDMVFSAGLMEHFRDETPFLNEMKRIMRPEAYMVTFVPARYSLWQIYLKLHFGNMPHGYEKSYTRQKLRDLFLRNGFEVVEIIGVDPFSLNAFFMKLLNRSFKPFIKKSIMQNGYQEFGIIVKKN